VEKTTYKTYSSGHAYMCDIVERNRII